MWPKYLLNGSVKMNYDQRFMIDEYSYRVSLTQMRQVRGMGMKRKYNIKRRINKINATHVIS